MMTELLETLFAKQYRKLLERQLAQFPNLLVHKKRVLENRGRTPFFLIDTDILSKRYRSLKQALHTYWGPQTSIAYSFKTNYEIAKTKTIKKQGGWAEVVSGKEYALAKTLGYKGNQIVFNGPAKRDADLKTAIADGAIIHIDNKDELFRFAHIAKQTKKTIPVGLRIHDRQRDAKESRFGFSMYDTDALQAVKMIQKRPYLHVQSIQLHAGSDIDAVQTVKKTAKSIATCVNQAEEIVRYPIPFLDVGGGFPASGLPPYNHEDWNNRPIEEYIRILTATLTKNLHDTSDKHLIVEPGRYLADDAVIFVTSVVSCQMKNSRQYIITDGAITMLPLKNYRPQIIRVFTKTMNEQIGKREKGNIYGGSCKEDDVLYEGLVPHVSVGDFIVYYCVGAYNQSMGSDFIFGTPRTLTL